MFSRLVQGIFAAWLIGALAQPLSAVTIEKVLPFNPAVDGVRIQPTLIGDEKDATIELFAVLKPAGQNSEVWKGSLGSARTEANKSATIEKLLENLPVQPWSPGAPRLYELTVTATQGKRPAVSTTVRFGFRTVESRNGNVILNGKPIFLRGIAINPPGRTVPDAVGESRQFAHDYVKSQHSPVENVGRLRGLNHQQHQ